MVLGWPSLDFMASIQPKGPRRQVLIGVLGALLPEKPILNLFALKVQYAMCCPCSDSVFLGSVSPALHSGLLVALIQIFG
jgi:hypothetical protein